MKEFLKELVFLIFVFLVIPVFFLVFPVLDKIGDWEAYKVARFLSGFN